MAKPNVSKGQTNMADMILAMNETDTFILITINDDDISVFSTLDDDASVAMYLQSSAKAVMLGEQW